MIFRSTCAPGAGQRVYRCQNIRARHSGAALAKPGGAITRPACKNFAKSEIRSAGRGEEYRAGNAGTAGRDGGGRERDNVYSDIASQRVYGEVTHHPRIVSLNGISI